MCFWPAKTRKKLNFFEMHTSLGSGGQKLLRHIWSKLNTASFHFRCVGEKSCIVCWSEFFSSLFQVLSWTFFVLYFYKKVCNWFAKVIWPRMDCFWSWNLAFFDELIPFWTENCMKCSSLLFFWRHQVFSIVWGVFSSALQMCLCFLARDLVIPNNELEQCIATLLLMFVRLPF